MKRRHSQCKQANYEHWQRSELLQIIRDHLPDAFLVSILFALKVFACVCACVCVGGCLDPTTCVCEWGHDCSLTLCAPSKSKPHPNIFFSIEKGRRGGKNNEMEARASKRKKIDSSHNIFFIFIILCSAALDNRTWYCMCARQHMYFGESCNFPLFRFLFLQITYVLCANGCEHIASLKAVTSLSQIIHNQKTVR